MKKVYDLKQFLVRQQVLKLYKDYFRAIGKMPAPKSEREELMRWVRDDFRKNQDQTDEIVIKMCIQTGLRSLKELQQSLELSGVSTTSSSSSTKSCANSSSKK